MSVRRRVPTYAAGGSFDSDSTAFFTATGITDTTQKNAVDGLVVALKGYGIWSKCNAIYPFVGGTAATHKYNLKDPQDTDAAFRIVFAGTITHDANGITPDGSTGSGNTKLVPSTVLTANSTHFSIYSRSVGASGSSRVEMGCLVDSTHAMILATRYSNAFYGAMYQDNGTGNHLEVATSDGSGMYTVSRTSSSSLVGYKNGSSVVSNSGSAGSLPNGAHPHHQTGVSTLRGQRAVVSRRPPAVRAVVDAR